MQCAIGVRHKTADERGYGECVAHRVVEYSKLFKLAAYPDFVGRCEWDTRDARAGRIGNVAQLMVDYSSVFKLVSCPRVVVLCA